MRLVVQDGLGLGPWPAGLVVVGVDLARVVARRRAVRSAELLLVATSGTSRDVETDVWRAALLVGADQVAVLPEAREWLVKRLARTAEAPVTARVVGVVGGCGGAGASTFAATLAAVVADCGRAALLVDLDPLGGGLDLALGLDDVPGLRWPDLASARGRLPATSLHESLPRAGTLAVLAAGRGEPVDLPVAATAAVLDAAARGHEVVVVDLPRTTDATVELAVSRLDELLVVVPARLRPVAAAAQLVATTAGRAGRVRAVVRRRPGDRWSPRQVADALGVPLAAQLRDDPRLETDLDHGDLLARRGRSGLRRAAEQCLASSGLITPVAGVARGSRRDEVA